MLASVNITILFIKTTVLVIHYANVTIFILKDDSITKLILTGLAKYSDLIKVSHSYAN